MLNKKILLLSLTFVFLPLVVRAAPPPPLNASGSDTGRGREVKITWARPTLGLVLDYNIYRSTRENSLGTKVGNKVAGEEFTDKAVQDGVKYFYRVKAVDQDNVESEASVQISVTPTDAIPPGAPTNVSVKTTAKGGKVTLSWNSAAGESAFSFQIFRSTLSGTLGNKMAVTSRRSYTESGLTAGISFYYTVRAMDKAGNVSADSTPVSALVVNEDAVPLAAADLRASATGRSGQIKLTWRNPTLSNFSHNKLYRSLSPGDRGPLLVKNIRGSSYTDKNLANGAQYYYTIQSVSKGGVEYENLGNQVNASPSVSRSAPPPGPAKIKAKDSGDGGSINLSWTNPAVHEFSQIRIYRSADPDEQGQLVSSGTRRNTFTDSKAETDRRYYYRVKAVSDKGVESEDKSAVGGVATIALPDEGGGADSDKDGLPDDWERENGYHPRLKDAPDQDDDSDGLGLTEEYAYGANPWQEDTDSDGYDDGTEVGNGFNPAGAGRLTGAREQSQPGGAFAYGRTRLASLAEEQRQAKNLRIELEKVLSRASIDKAGKHWSVLVNAYIYGGYSAEEIASTIRRGPGKVHPQVPAASWRQSQEYKKK